MCTVSWLQNKPNIAKIDLIEERQSHKTNRDHGKSVVAKVTRSLATGRHVTLPSISKHFLVCSRPVGRLEVVCGVYKS